jgi:hypothetical protein
MPSNLGINIVNAPEQLKRIHFFFLFITVGLSLALMYHGVARLLGYDFPYNTFLFLPGDRFNDWHNSIFATRSLNPYFSNSPAVSTYFPFSYWLFSFFTFNSRDTNTTLYLTISIALLLIAVCCSWRFLFLEKLKNVDSKNRAIAELVGIFLICYPMIFALDRGNLDIWIGSLCILYVVLFQTNYSWIGYICLCIAIMLKGYPVAFLLLSLVKKKYSQAFFCVFGSLFISVIVMLFFWGGFFVNLHGLQINLSKFYKLYVIGINSLFASSDPYNGIRTLVMIFNDDFGIISNSVSFEDWSISLLHIYSPITFITAALATCFILFSNGEWWAKITAVSLIILLFPNVANDYKLCILFPAIITLLANNNPFKKTEIMALIIMGLLLIPKSYIFINQHGLSNLINPILLISLSCITFINPGQWRGLRKKEGHDNPV